MERFFLMPRLSQVTSDVDEHKSEASIMMKIFDGFGSTIEPIAKDDNIEIRIKNNLWLFIFYFKSVKLFLAAQI